MAKLYKGLTDKQREWVHRTVAESVAREKFKRETGIYRKYRVSRTDGSSRKGKKHHGCSYFVLDLDHDKYAPVAIAAYAAACKGEYPALARDLRDWVFKQLPGEGEGEK